MCDYMRDVILQEKWHKDDIMPMLNNLKLSCNDYFRDWEGKTDKQVLYTFIKLVRRLIQEIMEMEKQNKYPNLDNDTWEQYKYER